MDLLSEIINESIEDATTIVEWPENFQNSESGKFFVAHNDEQYNWIYDNEHTYLGATGGEGSGKSTLLIMKILHKLKHGNNGLIVSPNLPAFRRAFWPEFLRWLPKNVVAKEHQRYFAPTWRPHGSFDVVVKNIYGKYSTLICASAENPITLEGPNLNFVAMEEIRGMPTDDAFVTLMGRIRIRNESEQIPQLFFASTPKKHWMFDWFGPIKKDDQKKDFKELSLVINLKTEDNVKAGNLDSEFFIKRGLGLTEAKRQVLLLGEWGDEDNSEAFIEDIVMWDRLKETDIPVLGDRNSDKYYDSVVLGIDGAVSRDHFAIVGVSRHPKNRDNTFVRICKVWKPNRNSKIDYVAITEYIKQLCLDFNIVTIVYDEFQLHGMMQDFNREGVAWCQAFNQTKRRSLSDQQLYDSILNGNIGHDGDSTLREHIYNADAKIDDNMRKRRLIKRTQSLKIDAGVATSMANHECLRLDL